MTEQERLVSFHDAGGPRRPAFYVRVKLSGLSAGQAEVVRRQAEELARRFGFTMGFELAVTLISAIADLAATAGEIGSPLGDSLVRIGVPSELSLVEVRKQRAGMVAAAMLHADDRDEEIAGLWRLVMESLNTIAFPDFATSTVDEDVGEAACDMRGERIEVDARLRWSPELWRPGKCYELAYLYVLNRSAEIVDVTGEVPRIVHGRYLMDLPHAWVEFRDVVYDGTCARFYDRASFFERTGARAIVEYTPDAAVRAVQASGNFGPW